MENLDILLERYLGLLDEYQRMKTRLHDDLAAVSQVRLCRVEDFVREILRARVVMDKY